MRFNGLNRLISTILTVAIMLAVLISVSAASGTLYVNGSSETLSGSLAGSYAVGSGGVGVIGSGTAYALTADGLQQITDTGAPSGDGFAEISGSIDIKYDTVKIGFCSSLNYSDKGTAASSTLTSVVGSGFGIGYYDDDREFVQLASTSATKVTVKPGANGNIVISDDSTGLNVYTSKSAVVALQPISNSGKAKTKLSNNGYTCYGGFEYRRINGGNLTIIGVLNIEDYVKGVIPYEMSNSWPVEALKAQAVAARNYVAANFNKYSSYGFDIINNAYDQVYRGTASANSVTDSAVDATAGLYLTYNGKLCSCYYAAADGGATEDSENVWSAALGYIRGKVDPYEAVLTKENDRFYCPNWTHTYTAAELTAALKNTGLSTIASITPTYTASGNMYKIVLTDVNGKSVTYQKSNTTSVLSYINSYFSATATYNAGKRIPYRSIHYSVVKNADGTYTFSGGGYGHNLGMSQWGAYAMAKYYGKTYQHILGFYYTNVCLAAGNYA